MYQKSDEDTGIILLEKSSELISKYDTHMSKIKLKLYWFRNLDTGIFYSRDTGLINIESQKIFEIKIIILMF